MEEYRYIEIMDWERNTGQIDLDSEDRVIELLKKIAAFLEKKYEEEKENGSY